jgi:N-acetyl-alpha-D-glucosaminyl L-malate synthase BshA
VVATELAMGLAGRGHEVHLVSDERPFRLAENSPVRFHRVTVTDYPLFKYPPHGLSVANRLAEVVLEHDIQIMHAHYAVPYAVSAIMARLVVAPHPVKVVTTLHGTDITLVGSHRDFYRICRYAMVECDGLTCVSRWLADRTMAEFDLPVEPAVIGNFVDCERFGMQGRSPLPADGAVWLMHASNFRPVKRAADIVRVFAKVRQKMPRARLLMVGDGPERGLAAELAAELGVCGAIEFTGATTNMGELYRRSHLYLLLSDYESFGLSALEAAAAGTPAVVSRAGGLTEVVEEGVTGALRPVGDVEAMAGAAVDILSDQARWQQMSAAASLRAHAMFCKDEILPRYEAFYEQVLAGAVGSGGSGGSVRSA